MEMHEKVAKHEQDLEDLNNRMDKVEEQQRKDHDTLVRCEQEHKEFKNNIKAINKLIEGISDMVSEVKGMRGDLNKVINRVDEIEKKPAKRWESVVTAIIGAVAGIVVGYLFKGGI